ncbi:MAG: CusA/CzcA family heavy metal efflux RND transporter [Bryobacterales bacterium]|nr:CusA/CzcA family heavy metal efflux RND transporter [Bryobacteraceae bacterium]MDW8355688.1 CusA/CzcA family heavy metal efflux RND transporter [Bryobacterales bacterium]
MLGRWIDFHLKHRWFVLAGLAALVALGLYTLSELPIDAFPDLTSNQVVVVTECPAMAPAEVEQLVTFPIETALMGLPRTEQIRSISKLGLSMVTVVFEDSVNTYFARQLVNERLQEVRARLPEGIEPALGPMATAFGEVYQYTLEGAGYSQMDLKTLHDWHIKPQLRTVPGVNEVNTWGGETRQYEVEVDPVLLERYGLSLRDVFERVRDSNANFGGGFIEHASEQYTVRGLGRVQSISELEQIVLLAREGTSVLLRDVARVAIRPMPRQGAVLRDDRGETVSGMVIMLKGENGRRVIERVKQKLASLRLPEGVRIVPFYDQSTVIDGTIRTVKENLFEAAILVVLVLLLFLGNIKAALIVASVIPLSMLVGFMGMRAFGISANLMSLGAIDFGMIVDGAVVMMENSVRRLRHAAVERHFDPVERVRQAAHEVARPIVFAVAIIIAVYLPILFLEGLEGRMFRPMAITVCSALVGSLVLALTVVPTAAAVVLRRGVRHRPEQWFERLQQAYETALRWVLRHRAPVLGAAIIVLAVALASLAWIGTEFMARLDEGSILIQTRKLPGISLTESIAISQRIQQLILTFPEVSGVVTKLGRPDVATEAMGIYEGDVYVLLKPREQWRRFRTKEELIAALAEALTNIPGVHYNFTQPMAMRLDEVVSGIKADVAVKIFGEDPGTLEQLAEQALRILSGVPGAADAQMEIVSGVAELRLQLDRSALARYGLDVAEVREVVEAAIGGRPVSEVIEGQRRFAVVVRLPERYRQDPAALAEVTLPAPGGERVRLGQIARIEVARGPEVIARENGQRRIVVQANVRGRDLGSFVAEAQRRMAQSLRLPAGYTVDWGGQFENQQRAMRRLMIVVPVTVGIIFALLFATFDSVPQALLILLNVPFALVGGIAALWLRGLNLNLSASIGFIALFGVAVLNGIVMVSYINRLRLEGMGCLEAVVEGARTRLRPVVMTALVASFGFLPMATATTTGAEVQRPLATVVIGGLVSSTLLTLFVLPALYPWFCRRAPEPAVAEGAEFAPSAASERS